MRSGMTTLGATAATVALAIAAGAPVLWADVPTLPLYRQQRTLLTSKEMQAVDAGPARWGAGWNMDRWQRGK